MDEKKVESVWWALRVTYGVIPIVAGLDKFFNVLANWQGYLSPLAVRLLPVAPGTFMRFAGIVEIIVGVAVLTRLTRAAAYVASIWLLLIAINLISTGHFLDVAARDVAMAVGAFSLARLDEACASVHARHGLRQLRASEASV